MRTRCVTVRSRALATGVTRGKSAGPMAIMRTLRVLEALSSGVEPSSLSQLARALKIPKSSLFTLLEELVQLGLVHRDEDGHFSQGGGSRRLGLQLVAPASVASVVRATLERITAQLGMTATFSRLDIATRALIYGDRCDIPDPVHFAVTRGQPLDLHCRSAGKLLVAHQPASQWPLWFGPEPWRSMTCATRTTLAELAAELVAIAAANIAWSRGESFPGVASCNVGVEGADGQVVAALGIETPMARVTAEMEREIVEVLREAAGELGKALRERGVTGQSLPIHL